LRIAHISDFHFTHLTWNPFRLFSKRILGNLNWIFSRRNHFSEKQLQPLPELFKKLGVDLLLLGGDFSTTALREEFEKSSQFIHSFSTPWIAIPGNHDRYTYRSSRQNHFYRHFSNIRKEISHPVEFFHLKEHGIEAHPIARGWWVIALDTTRATNLYSSQGLFSEKLESYLEETIQLIPKDDSILLFNHYPFFQSDEKRRNLRRGEDLKQLLKRHSRVRLYLHGHTHRRTLADLQPNQLPLILDSGSCAQSKHGSWNLIDLAPRGCTVQPYKWNQEWVPLPKEEFVWTRN